jgi:hypothetical protein
LRARVQGGRLALVHQFGAPFANELLNRWHLSMRRLG